jgi:salicylate hydroxylase
VVASELGCAVDATNWMGPSGHVVHYFVRARTLFNVVAVTTGDWAVESWTEPGEPADLRAAFAGWAEPLCRLLDRVTHTHRWALFDRDPLTSWTCGRVTLLGDACHPMLPYLAQGGAQAIEDGAALVSALSISGSVDDALGAYEQARIGRTAAIVLGARRNGMTYHLPDGDEQMARDRRLMAERPAPGGSVGPAGSPLAGLWAHDAAVIGA